MDLIDGIIDGPAIATMDGSEIYMELINNGDSVIRSEPVQAGGYFSFAAVPSGTYSVQTAYKQSSIYATEVEPSLAPSWVNTGEQMGPSSSVDGSVDGILSNVEIPDSITTGMIFGINKRPESTTVNLSIADPTYGLFMVLGTNGTSKLSGTDLEDGVMGEGDSIAITSLPDNGHGMFFNGSKVKYGVDGVNPPSESNPFYISAYDASLLQVRFIGLVSASLTFEYAIIDAGGYVDESPATYTLTWTSPLPMQLLSFEAEESNHVVILSWATTMEKNVKEYVVERMNENGDIVEIGAVSAVGNSNDIVKYNFIDAEIPAQSSRLMYRLRSVDFDGAVDHSDWKSVKMEDQMVFEFYPNPAKSKVTVNLETSYGSSEVTIRDMSGKTVSLHDGVQDAIELDLQGLDSGIYFITVVGNGKTSTQKLIIE